MLKKILFVVLFFCLQIFAGTTSDRINGVAQFLIDRANDNYLYIFEKKIKEDKYLSCYFTTTVNNLQIAGLKEILYSHQLWEESLKKDLDILATRSIVSSIEKTFQVSSQAAQLADKYIELMLYIQVEYKDSLYNINSISTDSDENLRNLINGFSVDFASIIEAISEFKDYNQQNLCNTPSIDYVTFKNKISALYDIDKKLEQLYRHIEKNLNVISIKNDFIPVSDSLLMNMNLDSAFKEENIVEFMMNHAINIISQYKAKEINLKIESIKNIIETFTNEDYSTTVKVVQALKEIQKSGWVDKDSFSRMKRYIMFFAQISDAKTADQVNEILKAYTLPSTSFFEKRKYGDHWLISSYLGVLASISNDEKLKKIKDSIGILGPIGFEYSRGLSCGSSFSIMISPFDFGYPITLKLNGIVNEIEFKEIIAPSMITSYGFAEYPLTIGIGFQKGRTIITNKTEEKYLFFIAFDMPLWILK